MKGEDHGISASDLRTNLHAKLEHPAFAQDCASLLRPGTSFDLQADFTIIDNLLISKLGELKWI